MLGMNLMITPDNLIASGYRSFKHHEKVCDETGFGKTFRNSSGKNLYQIIVLLWYFEKHYPGKNAPEVQASCEVRFYLPEGNQLVGSTGFTLTLHLDERATIQAIESFYSRAFAALDCVPDLGA